MSLRHRFVFHEDPSTTRYHKGVPYTWNLVIGALSVFQLNRLSIIRVSCFFVIWDCKQVSVGYEPGLLFVRTPNPVPCMSWLAGVWKTVIRLPMFPVLNVSVPKIALD